MLIENTRLEEWKNPWGTFRRAGAPHIGDKGKKAFTPNLKVLKQGSAVRKKKRGLQCLGSKKKEGVLQKKKN